MSESKNIVPVVPGGCYEFLLLFGWVTLNGFPGKVGRAGVVTVCELGGVGRVLVADTTELDSTADAETSLGLDYY